MVSYDDFRYPLQPDPESEPPPWGCEFAPIDAGKAEKYRAILADRAKQLLSVRFGPFWIEKSDETPPTGYDKEFFHLQPAEHGEGLVLISGKSPAEAMQAIVDHPERWRLDCSAFTHVVLGLARREFIGAKSFDKKFKGRLFFFAQASDSFTVKGPYYLRLAQEYVAIRSSPDGVPCGPEHDRDDGQLFQECPVGTIFVFRNGDVSDKGKADYRFEHTIRLGPDSFIAHALVGGKNILTLKELREGLASPTYMANRSGGESLATYAERVVWVRAAQLLNTHLIEAR
jgi:hypothetical protein